ncbi:MAG: HEAT repeat domain-containing protein [Armatimonadota bacterium]|jgi:hypothetical protein
MTRVTGVTIFCVTLTLHLAAGAVAQGTVVERRAEVLQAAERGTEGIPLLERALQDESPLVRRAAIRGLMALGEPARGAVAGALENDDIVVRRAALVSLVGDPTPAALPHLERALSDADVNLREIAVRLLLAVTPRTDEVIALLEKADQDEAPRVHGPAALALAEMAPGMEPFEIEPPDKVLLLDRPEMADQAGRIVTVMEIPLPRDGWRFRTDARIEGHRENWFGEDYDDGDWRDISIETAWTTGYIGVGWYRREIELPDRPEHIAAELLFEGVDESAWVWVNGVYVGGQDIGASGWNQPFRVDVTDELRWGAVNQITVRAKNTAAAGGIWRPVTLEALALR